jgi:DNA-binding YbaB/EbfC family protein
MDIQKLMKEAEKAQQRVADVQQRLSNLKIEGSSGGGLVTVQANGDGTVTGVKIEPSALDPDDLELLEDLLVAAISDAQRKSKEIQEQELGSAMGGLGGMPGLF